ncbi:V-type proton ATPase subunit S1 [Drosophila albomicans]|uniref:V-type proton ATPase subunit S1 n=1 Tax=Drosophila albomicans TaxID=7291 RepID=A0A6P8XEF3_DROAB|nr:V-type proton ATPase subunit S1 [Drosophila albomicans]
MFLSMHLINFLLILGAFVAAELPVTPPAIIWGVKLPKSRSIFEYVSPETLVEMLQPKEATPRMIIAYFANDLTSKDFSCLEPDCFPFLRQVKPFNYYSQVHQPLVALQTIAELRNRTLIWDSATSLLKTTCVPHEIHIFNFTDGQLNKHDSFMKSISDRLKDCPLVQIYTAHFEEFEAQQRRRNRVAGKKNRQELVRNVEPTASQRPQEAKVLRNLMAVVSIQKIMFAEAIQRGQIMNFKRTQVEILDSSEAPLKLTLADASNILKGYVVEIATSMGPLAIDVLPVSGNWHIWRMHFYKQHFKARDLLFYGRKFSFCCHEMNLYSEQGSSLTFSMFYMDVEMNPNEFTPMDLDYVAKSCWLCQNFLTPSVTQILFAIVLLLIILGVGLSMLLSIGRPKKFPSSTEPELYVKGYAER